jgi:hypothetical protein
MDQLPLIIGGIAALLLTKKKAAPVTAEQVQQITQERIQQAAPEAIGACVKMMPPVMKPFPVEVWQTQQQVELQAVNAKLGATKFGTPEYTAYQGELNSIFTKYAPMQQAASDRWSAEMKKQNDDYNALLESYRLKGWKVTTVNIGGLKSHGLADLGTPPTLITSKMQQWANVTYACPPNTLPIEYQGAIERSVQKNECIVLSSTNPSISMVMKCMCGSENTAVPQDVIDALKANGWVQRTISWKVGCPEQKLGIPGSIDWAAILGTSNCGDFSITYLCPAGKEPPPPPQAMVQVPQEAVRVVNKNV